MSRCRNCEQFSFFQKLNKHGLCEKCVPVVDNIVSNCARIMINSLNCLSRSDDFHTKLTHCNLLFEHARRLEQYEKKGIPTIKPHPSIFIEECKKIKKELQPQQSQHQKIG